MLVKSYLVMGVLVCIGFATAAIGGWKGPEFNTGPSQGGGGGAVIYGGGHGSGVGYSTWHGGK